MKIRQPSLPGPVAPAVVLLLCLAAVLACPYLTRPAEAEKPLAPAAPVAAPSLALPQMWEMSAPLISPQRREHDTAVSVKDPTAVFAEGKWHVFSTIRCTGYVAMEHVAFEKWEQAHQAPRHILKGTPDQKYRCAPQVFYFRPHKKWYLIHQLGVPDRKFMQVSFSTTDRISDPASWTPSQSVFRTQAEDTRTEGGLDYWIICDDKNAYLFFTNLKGTMYRMHTRLEEFPYGFRDCRVALKADVFEASHTYRLKGLDRYLTVIEANPGGRRYYKAYLADRLDGAWTALADSEKKPFAGAANVTAAPGATLWADNISHGELLREGNDETLTVDPANLRFLFQGVLQKDKPGNYGLIPWRLGLLTPKDNRE